MDFSSIFLFIDRLASSEPTSLDAISQQMHQLNENLKALTTAIQSRSFWNSPLFAAILGASGAIFVWIFQQVWNWEHKRREKLEKFCSWIVEQQVFWSPSAIFEKASHTSYHGTIGNRVTGTMAMIPDKPLGEKMVLELRSHVKFWQEPRSRVRKLFKDYEEALWRFNLCGAQNIDDVNEYLSRANAVFQKIIDLAEKQTGENVWTV